MFNHFLGRKKEEIFYNEGDEIVTHIEVVDSPSLETLKARLDRALSNLVKLKMSLLIAGGLD